MSFVGSKTVPFKIKGIPFNKNTATVSGMQASYDYKGEPVDPDNESGFAVLCDGKKLEDSDYAITYNNAHMNAGKTVMTIKGQGIYEGSLTKSFTINKIDIGKNPGISLKYKNNPYDTSEEWKPWDETAVRVMHAKNGAKAIYELTYAPYNFPVTCTVKWANNKKAVSYDAINPKNKKPIGPSVTFKGTGNFTGSITGHFSIEAANPSKVSISVSDKVASAKPNSYAVKPVLKDLQGGILKAGTDYQKQFIYKYENDTVVKRITGKGKKAVKKEYFIPARTDVDKKDIIPAGTVIRVYVPLKGSYTGTAQACYTIAAASAKQLKFSIKPGKTYTYTGNAITPGKDDITVKVKQGTTWVELPDAEARRLYDITGYASNFKKGKGKILIKTKNGYAGTAVVPFTIKPR